MEKKKKIEKKDYLIKKGEVLIGSSLLKKKDDNKNRNNFLYDNMNSNKAFLFSEIQKKENSPNILKKFKEEYKNYREAWNEQPKNCISNNFLSEEMRNKGYKPLCIDIEVAAICDLACPFCFREYIATPDKIISEKLCLQLIDQAAELKIPSIKFNWRGEPLLNPKLPDYIKYAKKKGILETIINTNATNLNEDNSRKLIDSGLDMMIYSFDGGSKETYEKMRPGRFKKNEFEKVHKNIINFSKIKKDAKSKFPYTKIQMILTKDTIKEKDNFFKLFSDYVDDVSLSQYTERGGDVKDLTEEESIKYHEKLKKHNLPVGTNYMRDIYGNVKVSNGRLPCAQPFQRLMITYEGRVAMCCYDWGASHPVGFVDEKSYNNVKDYSEVLDKVKQGKKGFELLKDIKMPKTLNQIKNKKQTISEIWYGSEIDEVRKKHLCNKSHELDVCKNCSFKDVYNWLE